MTKTRIVAFYEPKASEFVCLECAVEKELNHEIDQMDAEWLNLKCEKCGKILYKGERFDD